MRKVLSFFIVLFFLSVFPANRASGQADSLNTFKQPKLLIGFSLPHAFLNGFKLEALIPVSEKAYWYVSPEVYSGKVASETGKLSGVGFHTGLRYAYWQNERRKEGLMAFVQGDIEFNQFRIEKRDKYWVERMHNGQPVLVYEEGDVFKRIQRMGLSYRMGGLWYFSSGFYYEWTFGAALRRSIMTHTENYIPNFRNDRFPWSYGYSGITPLMGLRLGFMIR